MNNFEDRPLWTTFKWALGIGVVVVGLSVISAGVGLLSLPFVQGTRIVEKTLNADNVIYNYEWFHDYQAAINARVEQIVSNKKDLEGAAPTDLSKMRIELQAMRQSCRTMVEQYNANATKTNRSIFMGTTVPPSFDPTICEQ